jgi:hypothetical protein
LANKGLDAKLQLCGPCKISCQKNKTLYLNYNYQNGGDIMQDHEQKVKVKNQDSMGKTIIFLSGLPPSALGQF